MSLLEKVIFVADYIEPGRDFPGVERLGNPALVDLDEAMLRALDQTIAYVLERAQLLHPITLETQKRPDSAASQKRKAVNDGAF